MELWEIVHPDYRELVRTRAIARQQGEQPPSQYEIKIITKGGEERWLSLNVALIDFRGKPAGLCTAFDITDLKQTERALRESEATHRAFLEAIPDMIFRVSRDGRLLDFKPGKDLHPFVPASEFLGKTVSEILPAEVAPAIMERVQRALETGQMQTIEFELPEKDGPRGYQARLVAAGKDEAIAIVDELSRTTGPFSRMPWKASSGRPKMATSRCATPPWPACTATNHPRR
jgi:PAS domain S-box-containing protein